MVVWRRLLWVAALPLLMAPAPYGTADIDPYLAYPTRVGVTVHWETSTMGTSRVEYGESPNALDRVKLETTPTNHHEVVIDDLEPSKTYYYRVSTESSSGVTVYTSAVNSLYTARNRPDPFRFVFMGETHSEAGIRTVTQNTFATAVANFDPHLILNAGDHVNEGHVLAQWETFFQEAGPMISKAPLINAWGNHDDVDNNTDPALELATMLFHQPGNERYYALQYGNTMFIALDIMWAFDGTSPAAMQWLTDTLAAASDGVYDPAFIVVFLHPPFYGAAKYAGPCSESPQTTDWVRTNLQPLFEQYNVSLVLGGHEMLYAYAPVNGVHYLQVTSSDKLREIECAAPEVTKLEMKPSIAQVSVGCTSTTVEGYLLEGVTFEDTWLFTTGEGVDHTFTIPARPNTDCFYDRDMDGLGDHEDCDDNDNTITTQCAAPGEADAGPTAGTADAGPISGPADAAPGPEPDAMAMADIDAGAGAPADGAETSGCGCRSAGGAGGALLLALVIVALGRRERI